MCVCVCVCVRVCVRVYIYIYIYTCRYISQTPSCSYLPLGSPHYCPWFSQGGKVGNGHPPPLQHGVAQFEWNSQAPKGRGSIWSCGWFIAREGGLSLPCYFPLMKGSSIVAWCPNKWQLFCWRKRMISMQLGGGCPVHDSMFVFLFHSPALYLQHH